MGGQWRARLEKFLRQLRKNEADSSGGLADLITEVVDLEDYRATPLGAKEKSENDTALVFAAIKGELEQTDPSPTEERARNDAEPIHRDADTERSPLLGALLPNGFLHVTGQSGSVVSFRVGRLSPLLNAVREMLRSGGTVCEPLIRALGAAYSDSRELIESEFLLLGSKYVNFVQCVTPTQIYQSAGAFYGGDAHNTYTFSTSSGLVAPLERLGAKAFAARFTCNASLVDDKNPFRERNFTDGILDKQTLRAPRHYQLDASTTSASLKKGLQSVSSADESDLAYLDFARSMLQEALALPLLEISAVHRFDLRKRLTTRLRHGHMLVSLRGPARKKIMHGLVLDGNEVAKTPVPMLVVSRAAILELIHMLWDYLLQTSYSGVDLLFDSLVVAANLTYEGVQGPLAQKTLDALHRMREIETSYATEPHWVLKGAGESLTPGEQQARASAWVEALLRYDERAPSLPAW